MAPATGHTEALSASAVGSLCFRSDSVLGASDAGSTLTLYVRLTLGPTG